LIIEGGRNVGAEDPGPPGNPLGPSTGLNGGFTEKEKPGEEHQSREKSKKRGF